MKSREPSPNRVTTSAELAQYQQLVLSASSSKVRWRIWTVPGVKKGSKEANSLQEKRSDSCFWNTMSVCWWSLEKNTHLSLFYKIIPILYFIQWFRTM